MSEERLETMGKVGKYRSAWRGYWLYFLAMILVIVAAGLVTANTASTVSPSLVWGVAVVIDIAIFVTVFIKRIWVTLYIKSDEVELMEGFFSSESVEISYPSIQTVKVFQSLFQRMMNIGDISIASSGTGDFEIKNVKNIYDPRAVRNNIQYFERKWKNPQQHSNTVEAAAAAPESAETAEA